MDLVQIHNIYITGPLLLLFYNEPHFLSISTLPYSLAIISLFSISIVLSYMNVIIQDVTFGIGLFSLTLFSGD